MWRSIRADWNARSVSARTGGLERAFRVPPVCPHSSLTKIRVHIVSSTRPNLPLAKPFVPDDVAHAPRSRVKPTLCSGCTVTDIPGAPCVTNCSMNGLGGP
jgi:hypothetical protein